MAPLRRVARSISWVLGLSLLSGACSPEQPDLPDLPGVAARDEVWFWRDVLAAPLPGEPAPRQDVLAMTPPASLLEALSELSDANDTAVLTTLMAALRHEQEGVACAAARELGTRGERAAIPRLLKSLGPHPVDYDVPITVRAAAASALARLGNPAGVPLILMMLAEGTDHEASRTRLPWTPTTRMAFVQELALEGLQALAGQTFGFDPDGSIPDREAASARAQAWWEQNRLRLWATSGPLEEPGLVTRTRLLVAHLQTYQLRQIDGAVYTLVQLGPDVLPFLREGMESTDDYIRLHVLDVMRKLAANVDRKECSRLAVIAAGPLLSDPSPALAARAAGVCGAARVADPLINALEIRSEPEVRLAVLNALGATGLDAARDTALEWEARAGASQAPPDQQVALEASLLLLDDSRPPDRLMEWLALDDPAWVYPAIERLIALTGSDHGLDAKQPSTDRGPALQRARAALGSR